MEVDSWIRGSGSLGRCRCFTPRVHRLQFRGQIAIVLATIMPRFFAMIAAKLGRDRARSCFSRVVDRLPIDGKRFRSILVPSSPRSRLDRAAITARSRRDRVLPPSPSTVRWFDAGIPPAVRSRLHFDEDQPSDPSHAFY